MQELGREISYDLYKITRAENCRIGKRCGIFSVEESLMMGKMMINGAKVAFIIEMEHQAVFFAGMIDIHGCGLAVPDKKHRSLR